MALDLFSALRRRQPEYVLIDAAQDAQVLPFLSQNKTEWRSLYEGNSAIQLASQAPYLSAVPAASDDWLKELIEKGWGKAWTVFVSAALPLDELRRHFRKFLYVKNEAGEQLYFRFYDPRVLRAYLPTCRIEELSEFFGPVTQFIVEGDEATELCILEKGVDGLVSRTGTVTWA